MRSLGLSAPVRLRGVAFAHPLPSHAVKAQTKQGYAGPRGYSVREVGPRRHTSLQDPTPAHPQLLRECTVEPRKGGLGLAVNEKGDL